MEEAGEGHLERYLLCDPHRGIAVGGKASSPGTSGGGGGGRGGGALPHSYRCNRNKTRAARSGVFCLNVEAADRGGALMSLSGCGRGLNGQRSEVRAAPLSGGKREDGFYRCCCIFPLEIRREPWSWGGAGPRSAELRASGRLPVVNRGLNLLLMCRIAKHAGRLHQSEHSGAETSPICSAFESKSSFLGVLKCFYLFRCHHAVQ